MTSPSPSLDEARSRPGLCVCMQHIWSPALGGLMAECPPRGWPAAYSGSCSSGQLKGEGR